MSKPRREDPLRPKAPGARKGEAPSASRLEATERDRPALTRPAPKKPAPTGPAPTRPASLPQRAGARISRRAADSIRAGHVWVYASEIEALETGSAADGNPPALLPVADNRGLLLGTALYSPASQIALRMVSPEEIDEQTWLELLARRLRAAIDRRTPFLAKDTDACRLCFSEADELPGLVIDRYGELVILQLLTRGLDSSAVRDVCVRVLREALRPEAILERPDPRIRQLEGLSAPGLAPLWAKSEGDPLTRTEFRINGLVFQYDANAGQKTGAFLDQRLNYVAAAGWAERLNATGRALDVCTYQGGFALHLAQVCRQVTGVDASRASLEVAEANLSANRKALAAEVDWLEADAFELLRDWSDASQVFDTIVLDPPAFAKTRRAVEGALRGYKELNLRALKMLRPGGLLVTCSCSHHVGWTELEGAVAAAASDAHRRVRILERRGAAPDHPVVLNIPETEYLKCLMLTVD